MDTAEHRLNTTHHTTSQPVPHNHNTHIYESTFPTPKHPHHHLDIQVKPGPE
jgi:hypothetical protein